MLTKEIQIAILKKDIVKIDKKIKEFKDKIHELETVKMYLTEQDHNVDHLDINNELLKEQLLSLDFQRKVNNDLQKKEMIKKTAWKWVKKAFF